MGAGAVNQIYFLLAVAGACVVIVGSFEAAGVVGHSHGQCNHGHDHQHQHQLHDHHQHDHHWKLPEELAEEEDLKLYGFESHNHPHVHVPEDLSGLSLWVRAMGCSLLVSLASLICLIILPLLFLKGKPSKAVVDSLALFGAGAMLGDAFLHQLPHAFGGGHSHSHDHHVEHSHHHDHSEHAHAHAHSLEDLSVGLSVLAGIVLFLIVEKLVRYVEAFSGEVDAWSHGHHHHHHKQSTKLKDDNENLQELPKEKSGSQPAVGTENGDSADSSNGAEKQNKESVLHKRSGGSTDPKDKANSDVAINSVNKTGSVEKETAKPESSLVFGYLNLFSDGVHNFTDGIALGSAFLLYGSVGGWSRTLFLLAHELPQEIGDFGILVRSGFSVSKALFFNFLSALVALAGTALALTLGKDPGQSSLIEGFTAGGFIYISVAGVLAEMNTGSSPSVKNTVIQLMSLLSGMAVALCISLAE